MFYALFSELSKQVNYVYCLTIHKSIFFGNIQWNFLTGKQAIGPVGKNLCQATTLSGI
jgi:hypothetical protein